MLEGCWRGADEVPREGCAWPSQPGEQRGGLSMRKSGRAYGLAGQRQVSILLTEDVLIEDVLTEQEQGRAGGLMRGCSVLHALGCAFLGCTLVSDVGGLADPAGP